MTDFNENPFKKDAPVIPFTSGEAFRMWRGNNCENCVNYEEDSTTEEEAKCKLAFHIDFGVFKGTIPLWAAKEIGCKYDPLYGIARLSEHCRQFDDGNEIF